MLTKPLVAPQPNTLHAYRGGFFRLLVTPGQTDGNLALIEMTTGPGGEAPRHVHTREDELFHIMEGRVRFQIGDEVIIAGPGQTILAPRSVPHQFAILTDQARMLNLFTPGNFVTYILDWSQPIAEAPTTVQVQQGPPPADLRAKMVKQLGEQYGVSFV